MFLIDGSHLLHRIMHTDQFHELSGSGQRLGGVSGFIKSLEALVYRENYVNGIVVAWDLNCSDYRLELLPSYKERDTSIYSDGMIDIPKIVDPKRRDWEAVYTYNRQILHERILPLLGCVSLQIKGVEADDILYQLTRFVPDFKLIVSGDKDLLQLVSNESHVLNPMPKNRKLYDPSALCEKFDLIPEYYRLHFLLMKAMVGDTSDNIQGIDGVSFGTGAKFARSIIENKGLGALSPEKRKRDKAVVEGFNQIMLNLKLMDLSTLPERDVQKIISHTLQAVRLTPQHNALSNAIEALKSYGFEPEILACARMISDHNFDSIFRSRIDTAFSAQEVA